MGGGQKTRVVVRRYLCILWGFTLLPFHGLQGSKPGLHACAATTFTHWAIFPALEFIFCSKNVNTR